MNNPALAVSGMGQQIFILYWYSFFFKTLRENNILPFAVAVAPNKKSTVSDPVFLKTNSSGTPAEVIVEGRISAALFLNHV
jgi:hypothetical protein